jgi:molybdopterin synthase catalytic subunit
MENDLMQCLITREALSFDGLIAQVHSDGAGAIATFMGVICNTRPARQVRSVHYTIDAGTAEARMRRIGEDIRARWNIESVVLARRAGRVQLGDVVLAVAVAARHREAAQAACAYAVERIKQDVPVWKREEWDDGSVEQKWEGSDATGRAVALADDPAYEVPAT